VKAHAVDPGTAVAEQIEGRILAHTVRRANAKAVLFRKGQTLQASDLERVREAEGELHLLEPEPGDLHEDEAGARVARAVSGPGLRVTGPAESQYQLVAARRGLFRVDVALLRKINSIEGISVFSTFDHLPVEAGGNVGAAKVTPILIPESRIAEVERIAHGRPILQVKAFRPHRVLALVLGRVDQAALDRFARALNLKLSWFGSELIQVVRVEDRVDAFVSALEQARATQADVIMAAGASSLDPLEPLFIALERADARIEKHGIPAHPGSLFWIAYRDDTPIFGLSSCEMFSHKTILDLVLPRLMAGEHVGREELIEMGYGGLLNRQMAFRFPPYEAGGDTGPRS
jgi:hypothetical protein